ncbi:NADH-quinone oxidoreductase subunit M [bacterium]|nr:NADH-quinone oxidoreductase subunit M [bacterium]MCI0604823.1 NADH-quinone oxidoreductase subunit M [bacterium]
MNNFPFLSVVVFLPMLGGIVLLFWKNASADRIRNAALLISLVDFLVSLPLYIWFNASTIQPQFVEQHPWIRSIGVEYYIGIDGLSLFLVLLTTFLTPLCVLISWNDIRAKMKQFYALLLMLETGILGVFVSFDLFLFFLFWEAMMIPMYFLIGVWGGPNRIYAAVKFFLYTIAGSALMLVAIVFLFNLHEAQTGVATFNIFQLYGTDLPAHQQYWLFLAFFVAFAIKVPLFPFHTWLPDAHTEAPTAGSVILAGVLLKMGTYAILRFAIPLFPEMAGKFAPLIIILGLIGIIYGALVAMVQPDVKKLVAYSSVSHLGFVMVGMFVFNEQGLHGAILQMINHGLSTGALFLLVGMIYERRHTRMISEFGGVAKSMPLFFFFFLIVLLSSIGLPLLNGFVGEFLILLGAFRAKAWIAIVAATGVVWGAVYMLWMFQRMMFGPLDKEENKNLKDLDRREIAILVPIVLAMFWIGIYSNSFLRKMDTSVEQSLKQVKKEQISVSPLLMKEGVRERLEMQRTLNQPPSNSPLHKGGGSRAHNRL